MVNKVNDDLHSTDPSWIGQWPNWWYVLKALNISGAGFRAPFWEGKFENFSNCWLFLAGFYLRRPAYFLCSYSQKLKGEISPFFQSGLEIYLRAITIIFSPHCHDSWDKINILEKSLATVEIVIKFSKDCEIKCITWTSFVILPFCYLVLQIIRRNNLWSLNFAYHPVRCISISFVLFSSYFAIFKLNLHIMCPWFDSSWQK